MVRWKWGGGGGERKTEGKTDDMVSLDRHFCG